MKIKKTEKPLMVVLDVIRDGDFGHINGFVTQRDSARETGMDSLPYRHEYGALALSSQCSAQATDLYGWKLSYSQHGGLDMSELDLAVSIMRPIDRKLTRMNETEGFAKSFGQFVNRVSRALGAEFVMIRDATKQRANGPRVCAIGEAVSSIDHCAQELIQRFNPVIEARAAA